MFGVPCLLIYLQAERPIRLGLAVGAVILAGAINPDETAKLRERNFFGVLKVAEFHTSNSEDFRVLYHGNTRHGQQDLIHKDKEGRHEPLSYYHSTGPVGHVFTRRPKAQLPGQRIGIVGLGTGSLAY